MNCLKKRLQKKLFVCVLSLLHLTGCSQNDENLIQYYEVFRYNGGRAFLVQDNKAITALHCVKDTDDLIYSDTELDFAIIKSEKVLSEDKQQVSSVKYVESPFTDSSYVVRPGESGSPYMEDNVLKGVYVGSTFEESLITPIPIEVKEFLRKGE